MNKFSEGEWKGTGLVVTVCGKGIIAKCPKPQAGGVFECADNVKLIAAAPKLFKACEKALPLVAGERIAYDVLPPTNEFEKSLAKDMRKTEKELEAVIAAVEETK